MNIINIAIIGSTGSVGSNTIKLLEQFPNKFKVVFLAAENNYKLLVNQGKKVNAEHLIITNPKHYPNLQAEDNNLPAKLHSGVNSILELLQIPNLVVVIANNGVAALDYILTAIDYNQQIVLANKEALVSAGDLINQHLYNSKANIIPADSEHNAIYQLLQTTPLHSESLKKQIKELIITASGGPFYNLDDSQLVKITPSQAVRNPNWQMGKFISVNSASLVNKALEIIEAFYLFGIPARQIKAVYHPQSLIHGMVNYCDGSLSLLAYNPNMQVALAHAISPVDKLALPKLQFNCLNLNQIILEEIKPSKLKPITLAQQALKNKGNSPCVFNIANELAVNAFLSSRVKFTDIVAIIEYSLNKISFTELTTINQIYNQIQEITEVTNQYINKLAR